jgi:HAD superfamily hydrolase (TIGR01509 family)
MRTRGLYGFLFDLDGTLVQSEDLYQRATQLLLDPYGRSLTELTPLERSRIPGRSALQNLTFYCERFALKDPPEVLVHRRMDRVCRMVEEEGVMLVPGAREILESLRFNDYPCALASSSPRRYVNRVLRVTELAEFFDVVKTGDDVTQFKPHPEIFQAAARDLGYPPERCLVMEDAHSGILAGKAAGMKVLAVDSEHTLPEQRALADRRVRDYCGLVAKDLVAVIQGLVAPGRDLPM